MIHLDRDRGWLIISRCDYLYRDGERDEAANLMMGDGDILIPLPEYMLSREWDNRPSTNHPERTMGSDGQGVEIIIAEIERRLKS